MLLNYAVVRQPAAGGDVYERTGRVTGEVGDEGRDGPAGMREAVAAPRLGPLTWAEQQIDSVASRVAVVRTQVGVGAVAYRSQPGTVPAVTLRIPGVIVQ